ncbi:acyltransferase [Pantoea sp. NPDC088449]|uniref:acyltransferase n=1 Tax=Pantoea sp. NPDC088449 TaxID=3364392 RepID=UPI0037FB2698
MSSFIYKLLCTNGDEILNPKIDGLTVEYKGTQGGVVEIEEGAIFHNTIILIGSAGHIRINKTHPRGIRNTRIEMVCAYKFKQVFIDEGCSIESARFSVVGDNNLSVSIGKDCMFSSNILFRACDGHTIFDIKNGNVLNKSKPIILGDHIWIGAETTFLKGSEIPNNTIIGTSSIITKKHTLEFTAIAGRPATIVKTGVNWDRKQIPIYEKDRDL